MKWLFLIIVGTAGFNAIRPGEPVLDYPAAKACGVDLECLRRYRTARRDATGNYWSEEPARFIVWTPACPSAARINFEACNP